MKKFLVKNRKKIVPLLLSLVIAPIFLIPLIMMILGSFKSQGESLHMDLNFPEVFHFENYLHVIKTGDILRGYKNSLIITVCAVVLIIFFGAMAGIIISRRKDRKVKALYYYFVFGLTATMQMVTTYSLMIQMHLYGTYIGVILIFAAVNLPFAILTFSSFVTGVPKEIDEAAIIDGCNGFSLIFKVLIPIMKPVTITNLIIAAIGIWNNFQVPLYLMSSSERTTIPMMIFNFYGLYARNWNYVFAALVITVLPIVLLYLLLQKYIVEGMTAGAVKG
ncbi:MAG: carbohydrate ABC transporter permease [Acetivibrio sp.]